MAGYKNCIPYKVFGKKIKDFTLEEQREYNNIRAKKFYAKHYKMYAHENSFLRKIYGQDKTFRTLSPEEKREYYRLKQRECRAKKKI